VVKIRNIGGKMSRLDVENNFGRIKLEVFE